jgi:hypothetical protein
MKTYEEGRKQHRRVPQNRYLKVLRDLGMPARCDDMAEFLDVSPTTAKRNLDGLVYQGKVRLVSGRSFSAEYTIGLSEGVGVGGETGNHETPVKSETPLAESDPFKP